MQKLVMCLLVIAAVPCFADDCGSKWGYTGSKGPLFWGSLDPDYKACASGVRQSPIDIRNLGFLDNQLPLLDVTLEPSTFKVENTGHDLRVKELLPAWHLTWFGRPATLEQFHFHRKAEHYDRGVQHEGEIHLVFKDDQRDHRYVIAVWINEGTENSALREILELKPRSCLTSNRSVQKVRITQLLRNPNHYAAYNGSLTTPPCSENVTFLITLEAITASRAQLNGLVIVGLPPGNARPLQPYGVEWRQSP